MPKIAERLKFLFKLAVLIDYWPMSNMSDVIGGNDFYGGSQFSYTADRFNNSNSAIYFNNGNFQVPSGFYFSGDFTFITWINFPSFTNGWSSVFGFSQSNQANTVSMILSSSSNGQGYAFVNGQSFSFTQNFQLNTWYHLAYVLRGTTGSIYINGVFITSGTLQTPLKVTRTNNYIGNSNYGNAYAVYDEVKLFQGALPSACILNDYFGILDGF